MTDTTEDDVLEVRDDGRTSRLTVRKNDGAPVSGFDPDDVTTVDERLAAFRELYPKGIVKTSVTTRVDPNGFATYTVKARAKDEPGGYTLGFGHASRTEGLDPWPYGDRAQETAESAAINRSLRFLGIKPAEPTVDPDPTLAPVKYVDARSPKEKET